MWGAFIVLCGIGIFIWLIVCNTSSLETSEDDKNDRGRVEDLLQNGGGKRRARRKGKRSAYPLLSIVLRLDSSNCEPCGNHFRDCEFLDALLDIV